jgi:hypothetical protein
VRVLSTADTVRQALTLGGHILVATNGAAQHAILTILEDPTGAPFGVLQIHPGNRESQDSMN